MKASDCKCIKCGEQAIAFFPIFDSSIPSYSYCKKCLDKARIELMIKLTEINNQYKK